MKLFITFLTLAQMAAIGAVAWYASPWHAWLNFLALATGICIGFLLFMLLTEIESEVL